MDTKRIAFAALAALIATHALANTKVSLSQALATAGQLSAGKAVGAGMDNKSGIMRMAVEFDEGVKTVLVDPRSGRLTVTKADSNHDG